MLGSELLHQLREYVIENVDEHPVILYLCIFLGSILALVLLYALLNSALYALNYLK